jgi:hypothetical protein
VFARESVEVGNDGVEFIDFLLLRVFVERAVLNADGVGPVSVAVVNGSEATG